MGSSAKKKKEKAKDFVKPKLKVGKTRPKNTNTTNTSFTARSIVIKQQSLSESSRSEAALVTHQFSLLSSRNETQRKDALAFLTTYVSAHHSDLPLDPSTVLSKALPLLLDGNSAIRSQVLKLVRALPASVLGLPNSSLSYVRAGLTHLSTDIRLHALDMLDWMLEARGSDIVSLSGGWIKLLRTFQILLGWEGSERGSGKWSNTKSTMATIGSTKLIVHQLNTLTTLLVAGLTNESAAATQTDQFPYWHRSAHALPKRSNSFAYLNLFGNARDIDNEMYESVAERREIFVESGLYDLFLTGLDNARKAGGEIGRAAAGVSKVLKPIQAG